MTTDSYDFIVVGGGLAGLVVAARLSEDAEKSVLIVEAGSNRKGDPRIDTPGLMTTLYEDPEYDWMFRTEPQGHANNRSIAWPRGKVLGGSSAVNFSAIIYPSKANFNAWAELGNHGWTGDDMAKYFRKFLKYYPASDDLKKRLQMDWVDESIQGYDGPLPGTFPDEIGGFNEAWMETFKQLGWHLPGDPVAGEKLGVIQNPLSIYPDTHTRAYSASAYYDDEIAKRPNLHLLADTLVEKVILKRSDDNQVSATGVQVITSKGERKTINATKEVILSCGTIKSPQVLELSGIGSKDLLAQHRIPVVIDNPQVGENLQDHPFAGMSFEIADDQMSGDILRDPNVVQAVVKLYQETHTGPLSYTPLSIAYLPLIDANGVLAREQAEKLLQESLDSVKYDPFPAMERQYSVLRSQLLNPKESSGEYMFLPMQLNTNPDQTIMSDLFSKRTEGNYISIIAMINHPFSRGYIHIQSADPTAHPRIDPRYLSHPVDLEMLARQVQYLEKVVSTEPFASLLKKDGRRIPTSANAHSLDSAKAICKQGLFTAFHPAGTCAMMSKELGGVVDSRLKVHGTTNLRVIDASIFPIEPLGNIQATVYAVAEKGADLIKEDW